MKRSTQMLTTLAIAGLLAMLPATAGADVIALYDFGADTDNTSFASADTDAVTDASDFSDAALDGSINDFMTSSEKKLGESPDPSGWPVFRMSSDNFNTDSTFGDDTGRYVSFSITATNDPVPEWVSLTFDWARTDATKYSARLLSSTEDTDGTFGQVGDDVGFGPDDEDTWVEAEFDLSALGQLDQDDTRYFRLQFAADNPKFGNARSLVIDDIAVTIPEPATMSLLAIGGLGVLLKRKRMS